MQTLKHSTRISSVVADMIANEELTKGLLVGNTVFLTVGGLNYTVILKNDKLAMIITNPDNSELVDGYDNDVVCAVAILLKKYEIMVNNEPCLVKLNTFKALVRPAGVVGGIAIACIGAYLLYQRFAS